MRTGFAFATFLVVASAPLLAQTVINSDTTVTLSGSQSAGNTAYDVKGGYSEAVANGDYAGHANGTLELRDSATAANAAITVRRGETLHVDPGSFPAYNPGISCKCLFDR